MIKLKVLAVDDDPDILDLLCSTLEANFDVATSSTGYAALKKIKEFMPDILVLDYMLPDLEGPQVCAMLRKDPLFLHLPILMLTGRSEVDDKVTGLEAGADDYMVKPFQPQELIARIRMLVRRSDIHLDANPLTRLAGNVSITKELENKIAKKEKFAVLYLDIDHFKAINDHYGFQRGDKVIKDTAHIIIEAVQKKGNITDFIGHIGGDDFVVLTTIEKAEQIAKRIIADFDTTAPQFFDEKDRTAGFIETKSRDGQVKKFSFPTVSIGIITNLNQKFNHVAQISSLGAEIKGFAKKLPESKYIFDRRSI